MAQRLPFDFVAEYRGKGQPSDFVDRSTGEKVDLAAQLKFEYQLADGEPDVITFRENVVDKAAAFDPESLAKGDWVRLAGVVVVGSASERSYLRLIAVDEASEPALRAA